MRYSLFLLSLCFLSCTEIFEREFTSAGSDRIIITGGITNLESPAVRIYKTVPYSASEKSPPPISGAIVWIEDDSGLRYQMEETQDSVIREYHFFANEDPQGEGEEFSEAFWDIDTTLQIVVRDLRYQSIDQSVRGEVGKKYTLKVELPGGERFESTPQLLTASPDIKRAYAEYENRRKINELGNEENDHKWNIYIETDSGVKEEAYLTWRYKGVYEFETFPEDYCDQPENDCDPGPNHPRIVPPGCCKYCYITEYGQNLPTSNSQQTAQGNIHQKVASIPMTFAKLQNYYKLDIYQLSISSEIHEYLEFLDEQITGLGTIFDPTPGPIEGNIFNADNPSDRTLGMFYAAGVSTSQLNLNRMGLSISFAEAHISDDCRNSNNSSEDKPVNYISGKANQCYNWWTETWQDCGQCYDFVRGTWSKCPEWIAG